MTKQTQSPHPATLLLLGALAAAAVLVWAPAPIQAQTAPAQRVSFQVQMVQAGPAAIDAVAQKRLLAAADLVPADTISLHILEQNAALAALVQAQATAGTLELIATPVLSVPNGRWVDFLIGGQYAVPVVADEAALAALPAGVPRPPPPVIPRELGIRLRLRPILLPDGKIRIRVLATVTSVDFEQATLRSGYFVPAMTSRQINTFIDIAPGQGFAITGLVNEQVMRQFARIPELAATRMIQTFEDAKGRRLESNLLLLFTPTVLEPPAD